MTVHGYVFYGCGIRRQFHTSPTSHTLQAFYDGTNISRDAIPPFDCTTHTLTALGFDPELTRIRGGLTPVIPARCVL